MKSETEEIFYGKQPNWKHWKPEDFKDEEKVFWSIAFALNWYNVKYTDRDYKKSVIDYMEKFKVKGKELVVKVPVDNFTFRLIGGKCQAALAHCILPDKANDAIKNGISDLIRIGSSIKDTEIPMISVRERVMEQAMDLSAVIEGEVDKYQLYVRGKYSNYKQFDVESWLAENEPSAMHCEFMLQIFEGSLNEYKLVLAGTDPQLKEAYSHFTKKQLQKVHDFYKNICEFLKVRIIIAKSNRKPRKPRKKKPEKVVKKLKYLAKDTNSGIESIMPESIVGCMTLITFNVKNKKATIFKADENSSGISVKGTTLIGFSEKDSVEKTIKKPVEFMTKAKNEGIRSINNYWKSVKTKENTPNGRINANILILRAFK
jgi:hypothetical protein